MHDDNRFGELEELGSWQLVHDDQDIRGRPVIGAAGERYGTVEEMLVDKKEEHVAAVKLDDGRIVPASHLEIREREVLYHDAAGASRAHYAKVRRPDA